MARLTKFVVMAVFSTAFATTAPTSCQAGVIPWVYDAVFGPVGSLRYGSGYTPTYYAGYGYRGYGATGYSSYGYTPMTVAYAPYASGCSSCATGCSSCSSGCGTCGTSANYGGYAQSYYVPSSGCASGNCSTCGSAPITTTSGYVGSPTPDLTNNSIRDTLQRINDRLDRLEFEHRQHGDFLKDRHDFEPKEYRGRTSETYKEGNGTVVRPREKRDTFTSGEREEDFTFPEENNRRKARPVDAQKPTLIDDPDKGKSSKDAAEVNESKIEIPVPSDESNDGGSEEIRLGAPKPHSPAPADIESSPESRRLIEKQTAKAVAPRQRAQSTSSPVTKSPTTVASKPRKSAAKVRLDSSLNNGISRN